MQNRNTILTTILLALGSFALSPIAQAVVPAPDGGYPGNNTAEGQNALLSLTSGTFNTAVGWFSLRSDTTGQFNTAFGAGTLLTNTAAENTATGAGALLSNSTGFGNTANGAFALFSNTTGSDNTATGTNALRLNTTANSNTANGVSALANNTTGQLNTAIGAGALLSNTTGNSNTANGVSALANNTTGQLNAAIGGSALLSNTTGNSNTANGVSALTNNTTGQLNTAIGASALFSNTTADSNTAVGVNALVANVTGTQNTGIGLGALFSTTGNSNTALGYGAGADLTGDSNIDIGVQVRGFAGETNTIRIGDNLPTTKGASAAYVGGINNQPCDPDSCFIVGADVNNKLGTHSSGSAGVPISTLGDTRSSLRFKDDVKAMNHSSEVILALKPVTFHYKDDAKRITRFGLIAEEVAEVDPELVAFDKEGKPYRVRYEQVNAMLLNEFLKEHRKVQELETGMAGLTAQFKEQAAQIQKVSAQIEMRKPTRKVALNNQ
jgi:hypothetical protein